MSLMYQCYFHISFVVTVLLNLANSLAVPINGSGITPLDGLFPRQTTSTGGFTVNIPPPKGNIYAWVAFGDSFSAGPGAGTSYNNDQTSCMRREGAYPPQLKGSNLFFSGYNNPNLNFLSCTGDVTTDVQNTQIPAIASFLPNMGIVTLSIGGNDIGFSTILTNCVFNPFASCTNALSAARYTLYEGDFYNNYFSMINLMIADLKWCPPSGGTRAEDCFTLVYQTAYPSFFETYTTQCNKAGFTPIIGGPSLTQALRSSLNQVGQEVNTMLAYYVANINQQQAASRDISASFMEFVDQGERYAGHRFCRDGVQEPDLNNADTWFFNLGSNADTATVFGGTDSTGPASAYTATDPNSCSVTDDMGDQIACLFSQLVADGQLSGSDQVTAYGDPEARTKTFHPNTAGFGAVSAEIQQKLGYVSAITTGRGCPSLLDDLSLRILGIGDSITAGFQSSDGQGYFSSLDEELGVVVAGCSPNTYSFIGSQVSGAYRNEGHSGFTVSQIQSAVESSGTLSQRPNLILLMAGTNDINQGADPQTTAQTLSGFIDYLFQQCPDATILVQHIPAIGYQDFSATMSAAQQSVIQYNAAISVMVDTRIAQGQHISKVHQRTTTFQHHTGDTLHPDDTGYTMIGAAWGEAITVVDQRGWISVPEIATGSGGGRIQCASGLFWDPQGQIANGAALGANIYPGITCFDNPEDTNQCSCIDDSNPNAIAEIYDLSGPSCADMSYPNATAVHFADLNGDGRAEYLWVGPNGEVTAYYNNGYTDNDAITNGAHVDWIPAGEIAVGIGGLRAEIRFADLNGDGRADYLWVNKNGSVIAYLNGGQKAGSATPANINWLPQGMIANGIGENGAGTLFADLAGVGRSDYIWVDDVGALTGYLNLGPSEGDGINADHVGWLQQGIIATGIGEGRWNTQFGDIDGDGRDDYLGVSLVDGSVREYRNAYGENEGAQALEQINWVPQGTDGIGTIATGVGLGIQFADLNGDGRVDYISVDPDTSAATLWLNRCQNPVAK